MEYYSAIKNRKILPFAIRWMYPGGIILSEKSHTEKDKYYMISLICRLKKDQIYSWDKGGRWNWTKVVKGTNFQ